MGGHFEEGNAAYEKMSDPTAEYTPAEKAKINELMAKSNEKMKAVQKPE